MDRSTLENLPPTPFVREQRLKEADWLLRHYGFTTDGLPYDAGGDLPLHLDPSWPRRWRTPSASRSS